MASGPVTPEEQQQIRSLYGQGKSLTQIARTLERSTETISRWSKRLGLSYAREATMAATAARQADNRKLRAELETLLLDDARRLRAQVWQEHEYIDHGGKEFVEVRWTQPEPSPSDKLKLMQAAGVAVDRSLRIAELTDDGADAARSMLGALDAGLRAAYVHMRAAEAPADAGDAD